MIANIDEREQLAAVVGGAADAARRSRRDGGARARALHQGVGAQRRLVHGDQQPEQILKDLRG